VAAYGGSLEEGVPKVGRGVILEVAHIHKAGAPRTGIAHRRLSG